MIGLKTRALKKSKQAIARIYWGWRRPTKLERERFGKKATAWETAQTRRMAMRHIHAELASNSRPEGPIGVVSRIRRGGFELFLIKQNGDYHSLGTFSSRTLERLEERMHRICFKFACDSIHLTNPETKVFVRRAVDRSSFQNVSERQIAAQVRRVHERLGNARAWLFFKRFIAIKKSLRKAVKEALSNGYVLPETNKKAE